MENLYQKLLQNGKSDFYPYHMPGHKRKPMTEVLKRVSDIDITEIDGFDNLHHAEGILYDLQSRGAQVYGSEECHYLVGGSTAGILSAVSAVASPGDTILIARNCHKAVYHSAYLRGINLQYLVPETVPGVGFAKGITADQIRRFLAQSEQIKDEQGRTEQGKTEQEENVQGKSEWGKIKAVLIVSPTYEGMISEVAEIAEVAHSYGLPLIVDEAHGAHFGFHPAWPASACTQGADIVIQSLHKTLPSMTQTALLHINGNLVDREKVRRFLSIYQTSSPSYVFMAGMGEAVEYMTTQGREKMEQFVRQWSGMLKKLESCKILKIYPGEDIGKLVISVENSNMTGNRLYDVLLNRYHLQMEMASGSYVLAMFTVADEAEAYERLTAAVLELDEELFKASSEQGRKLLDTVILQGHYWEKSAELWESWDKETELVEISDCANRVAGEFINLYPPGIPVVVPGEILKEDILDIIKEYIQQDLPVQGLQYREGKVYVRVIYG